MIRSILTAVATGGVIGLLTAGAGCNASGVGDPCTPDKEYDATFHGFDKDEVNTESKSYQCQTRLCLVNHFRGRVSCPLGQNENGEPPASADPTKPYLDPRTNKPSTSCVVPGSTSSVEVDPGDPKKGKFVPAQCADRTADKAVYCSCRCANADGKTDDGAPYCTCPSGFSCSQLEPPVDKNNTGLTGAYCIKSNTEFVATSCSRCLPGQSKCD